MNNFMQYDFNISKIVLACYVGAGTANPIHKNRPSHGLAFFTSGVNKYKFENSKSITTNSNDIIYLPKYSNYEVSQITSSDCFAINFDLSEDLTFAPFKITVKNPSAVLEHFKKALIIWNKKSPGYILKCKAELYGIIYTMVKEYYSDYIPGEKYTIIKPAVERIHREYTEGLINISELSDMCGITPEYFRKLFKSFYGISPLKYINNLKITHAKELLASGMYSVTEAALQSGYIDMSYFSREFKKASGNSPKYYC